MDLNDLKKSILKMSPEELQQAIINTRNERRMINRIPEKKKDKTVAKRALTAVTVNELEDLLKELGG